MPIFLCRATTNKKLKETVALELSYVNSNLQLLKEELADLNSSVQIYQNDGWVTEENQEQSQRDQLIFCLIPWLIMQKSDSNCKQN